MRRAGTGLLLSVMIMAGAPTAPAVAQGIPSPHDTIFVTASIPYGGQYGTGQAYVYLADSLTGLSNPVIAVEGFDLDNSWDWDELYGHLNTEVLLETLRAEGFDIVILDFTDATDYVQLNSFVLVELIEQVQSMIFPSRTVAVAGASMGGLCARYALAYMETNGIEHRVRNYISFDAPHGGANIPLGIQYWLDFFSGLSDAAAELLAMLDRPAARQMLVYHYTDPPGATGEPDPLRASMLADFAAAGEFPQHPRKVAIANGSGSMLDQGFAAGGQIIEYEYADILTTIRGNVWAVPDGVEQTIFDGYIRIIILPTSMTVSVSGTRPYDSAPGGWRESMADMDATEAPYGDIVALFGHHCFIPTVSALALDTEDLFYNVAGDPDILSRTPFDMVYYPLANQDHASVTAENAQWFIDEVRIGVTDGRLPPSCDVVLHQNYPNPFNPATTISFDLPRAARVRLCVYNVKGELVSTLIDGRMERGRGEIVWNATDGRGRRVASGVYFYRLTAGDIVRTKKMVLLK
ncbi:MAG TPA: T9SS type A sorting domain-containing protein [Candidatus Eisenbacteria bacterium]|uniref:T9SS type A sorting domain-containing protein n=1 Tax=Eiseniibacteriota bacterium TaxID=2212470 RepID=A0A7V2AUZ6_UNCEI|nr:T9SS type A sorting domain-containing protein [Candidatus Eisenbacteria bacterium]